ncbi:hypothetical protein AFLA70_57g004091 [Aspergillus flavus AF70]|nr:hypothetical protein AFLA70_57g004091 [Aspergillus flavus AF70]
MVSLGSTTLIGPNVSIYSAGHPTNPDLRNGTKGPEWGRPITIEDDCWIAGNVIILPGVITSDGCTIGAGSVVTKDIPEYHVAVGNSARVLRSLYPNLAERSKLVTEE